MLAIVPHGCRPTSFAPVERVVGILNATSSVAGGLEPVGGLSDLQPATPARCSSPRSASSGGGDGVGDDSAAVVQCARAVR